MAVCLLRWLRISITGFWTFLFFLFLFFFLFLKSLPPRIHSSCSTVLLSISRGTDTSVFSKYSVSIRIVRRRVVTSNSVVRLRVEYLRQSSFYSGHSFFFLFTVISPVVWIIYGHPQGCPSTRYGHLSSGRPAVDWRTCRWFIALLTTGFSPREVVN